MQEFKGFGYKKLFSLKNLYISDHLQFLDNRWYFMYFLFIFGQFWSKMLLYKNIQSDIYFMVDITQDWKYEN